MRKDASSEIEKKPHPDSPYVMQVGSPSSDLLLSVIVVLSIAGQEGVFWAVSDPLDPRTIRNAAINTSFRMAGWLTMNVLQIIGPSIGSRQRHFRD